MTEGDSGREENGEEKREGKERRIGFVFEKRNGKKGKVSREGLGGKVTSSIDHCLEGNSDSFLSGKVTKKRRGKDGGNTKSRRPSPPTTDGDRGVGNVSASHDSRSLSLSHPDPVLPIRSACSGTRETRKDSGGHGGQGGSRVTTVSQTLEDRGTRGPLHLNTT